MITVIIRTTIMFAIIIITMRLMGKRQLGQLELSELVVAVMISEVAALPISDDTLPISHGIVPVLVLLICELLISYVSMKSIKFRELTMGTPSIMIQNGQINQKEMRKNRFTVDELTEALRAQGVTDISTVKYSILEVDGTLTVLPYNAHCPVKNKSVNITEDDTGLPVIVINDGRVLDNNLKILGLDKGWLNKELNRRNVSSPKEVFILSVDECGNTYFAAKKNE